MPAACGYDLSQGATVRDTTAFQLKGYYSGTSNPIETANGLRADVEGASARHCRRITTLTIFNQNNPDWFVETGWLIGWDCSFNQWFDTPRMFRAWSSPTAGYSCLDWGGAYEIPDNQFDQLRVSDLNSNGWWGTFLNGAETFEAFQPGFTDGFAVAGGERDNFDDVSLAHIKKLQWYETTAWINWSNLRRYHNNQTIWDYPSPPHYECQKISNTEMHVAELATSPCP